MLQEMILQKPGPDWITLLIDSIRSWCLTWNFKKKENYYLIE
jgi:hypothetical protein